MAENKSKPVLAERLIELRKDRQLTQRQLANETGLSYSSIVGYENGLRQPNSKAMTALERYFRVSGEFLRGEVDRDTFIQKSDTINGGLDEVIRLFSMFKEGMACSAQDEKLLAVDILRNTMETITVNLLQGNPVADISANQVNSIFSASFLLDQQGRDELAKRAEELLVLSRYAGIDARQA